MSFVSCFIRPHQFNTRRFWWNELSLSRFSTKHLRFWRLLLSLVRLWPCHYIYSHGWRKEGLQLLNWLLEGYSENMRLNVTLAEVTLFCQWRLIYIFLVYARKWGFEHLSQQQAEWFERKRENIARGYQWSVWAKDAYQRVRRPPCHWTRKRGQRLSYHAVFLP